MRDVIYERPLVAISVGVWPGSHFHEEERRFECVESSDLIIINENQRKKSGKNYRQKKNQCLQLPFAFNQPL